MADLPPPPKGENEAPLRGQDSVLFQLDRKRCVDLVAAIAGTFLTRGVAVRCSPYSFPEDQRSPHPFLAIHRSLDNSARLRGKARWGHTILNSKAPRLMSWGPWRFCYNNRKRKVDRLGEWCFHFAIESLPVMLQLELLMLSCAPP